MNYYKQYYDSKYWKPSWYASDEKLEEYRQWIQEELRKQSVHREKN